MTYLVDTSWIIEALRGNQEIAQRLRSFREEGLAVSIVSVGELYKGIFRADDQTESERGVNDFLTSTEVLTINSEICILFGREYARLRQQGKKVGDIDLFIGATALHHGLTLLTLDSDFERIEGLQIISS